MFKVFMSFFKHLAGAHKWGPEESCTVCCDLKQCKPYKYRECKLCGASQTKVNGVWEDIYKK